MTSKLPNAEQSSTSQSEIQSSELNGPSNPVASQRHPESRPFRDIVQEAIDRRSFLHVSVASTCAALLVPTWISESLSHETGTSPLFNFKNVPPSQQDHVVVPQGYVAEVLFRWGDPINGTLPMFRGDASNSADEQAMQAGMGHDGMEFFAIDGVDPNKGGLLCINHEYTDQVLLFADGIEPLPPAPMPLEKVRKSQASHGISIVEVAKQSTGEWQVVDSRYARRVTADTPMRIAGPGSSLVGETVRGTINNCASGRTPWGTFLTCEENFQGVFGSDQADFQLDSDQQRYGLRASGYQYTIDGERVSIYRWWQHDPRFDLARPENDSKRFGYVVEIDPYSADSTPTKRTALGRIKHENAELVLAADNRVVVYMGDDEADEFIYKYVSRRPYDPARSEFGVEATNGLLDDGTLYVAKFLVDGRGEWLALVPGMNNIPAKDGLDGDQGFSLADVSVHTRQAASLAGATPMDRPEWIAAHPTTGEVFATLTNNRSRSEACPANPRTNNLFGHILRWHEDGNDAAAETFSWKVFVLAGNPSHQDPTHHGNVAGDAFGCPDGLKFDSSGILWIQTDISSGVLGKPDFAELGNNMMLAADPTTGEVRRFLTGPKGCEVTGIAMTPDRKTMFVNIQHPGEPADELSDPTDPNKYSNWPDGRSGGRPRSATIAIRKLDGGEIGS